MSILKQVGASLKEIEDTLQFHAQDARGHGAPAAAREIYAARRALKAARKLLAEKQGRK